MLGEGVLTKVCIHNETNEVLSDEIFEKLHNKRIFLSALMMMRQFANGCNGFKITPFDGDLDTLGN